MRRSGYHKLFFSILLSLSAGPSLGAESVLNFPRLSNQADTLTGVTFINPNPQPAAVTVTAYRTNGTMVSGPGIQNPANLLIPANQQLGLVTTDPRLFGPNLDPNLVAWFQATSPADGVTGFFLFLDTGDTFLDGADLPPTGRKIAFNQIRVGQGRSTELNLINPADQATGVDLLLIDGEDIYESNPGGLDLTLEPKGSARLDAAQWFGVNEVSPGAYVLVLSDTNIGGFEFVRAPGGDLLGLNARCVAEELNSIYFPQLAVLGSIRMEIGVTNYAPESATLFITARRPDGSPYGDGVVARNRVVRNLGPGGSLREDVQEMFGFQGANSLEGWIQVESTTSAVNGYVTYGVPSAGSIAAVAAPARPTRRAVFSHIATTLGFFTGVAALNPSALATDLRIVAVRPDGSLLGSFDTVLGPGQRISSLIENLIPAAANQAGGVIWVSSGRPVYLTSLFGTNQGSVLANIPPQPIPDGYRPDLGVKPTRVTPTLEVVGVNESTLFQASGPAGQPSWSLLAAGGFGGALGGIDQTGLYQAPATPPELPVTVLAEQGGRVGGATLDVLSTAPFEAGLGNVVALAYSEFRRVLYAARSASQGVDLLRVDPGSTTLLGSFAGEIGGILPYQDYTGREYLLVTERATGILVRFDPLDNQTRDLVGGFENPGSMAFDPVTGNLLVVDEAGLTEVARTQLESDVVSGLDQNGSLPRILVASSDVGGVAVDGCDGRVYYTHTSSGEVRSFDPRSGVIEVVAIGLQSPGALTALHRRDAACADSLHLLVAEPSINRVTLVARADGVAAFWPTSSPVRELVLLARDNSFSGTESVLAVGPGPGLTQVATTRLYQSRAVNPLDAFPTGIVSDPVNDLFQPRQTQLDLVELSALYDQTSLQFAISFADPVDVARGYIDLDADSDSDTGLAAATDLNTPYSSGLGVDFYVDLCDGNEATEQCEFDPGSGSAPLYRAQNGAFELVGEVAVQYFDYFIVVTVPRALLGGVGQVRVSAVFGPSQGPSDASPNGGYAVSQEVFSLAAATASRPAAKRVGAAPGARPGKPAPAPSLPSSPGAGWRTHTPR